jgi:acyl-CoA hydrolase
VPLVVYGDGYGSPRSSPAEVLAAAGLTGDPEVLLCWFVEELSWLSSPTLRGRTAMAGYGAAKAVAAGRLDLVSVRLSGMPALVAHLRPDVCVVTGVRRSSGGFGFGTTVGWSYSAARLAECVVIEVDEDGFDFGGPDIPGNIVATIARPQAAQVAESAARPADAIDLRIGANVASLVPDGATLQFGPGGVGEGICLALDRPVSIWSGLVTDAMAGLAPRGLLAGKVTAGYIWGGEPVRDLARAGLLNLQPIEVTHDITKVSQTPRFIGCNTALQVDLAGSVNIEQLRGRQITSIGGHSDFCTGASRSPGGLSVIALRSTTPKGESSIVSVVERVSTQRSDVSAIVTEHGIADLRGASDNERALRIVEVASPEHRQALREAMA